MMPRMTTAPVATHRAENVVASAVLRTAVSAWIVL